MAIRRLEKDYVISGEQGEAYAVIDGRRYNVMSLKKIEATIKKDKTSFKALGRTGKLSKATGWTGEGSATFYFNSSVLRQHMLNYVNSGKDLYFELQITNEDPNGTLGRQTVILKNCNLDEAIIAYLSVDDEILEEDASFTFDGVEMPEKFNERGEDL